MPQNKESVTADQSITYEKFRKFLVSVVAFCKRDGDVGSIHWAQEVLNSLDSLEEKYPEVLPILTEKFIEVGARYFNRHSKGKVQSEYLSKNVQEYVGHNEVLQFLRELVNELHKVEVTDQYNWALLRWYTYVVINEKSEIHPSVLESAFTQLLSAHFSTIPKGNAFELKRRRKKKPTTTETIIPSFSEVGLNLSEAGVLSFKSRSVQLTETEAQLLRKIIDAGYPGLMHSVLHKEIIPEKAESTFKELLYNLRNRFQDIGIPKRLISRSSKNGTLYLNTSVINQPVPNSTSSSDIMHGE